MIYRLLVPHINVQMTNSNSVSRRLRRGSASNDAGRQRRLCALTVKEPHYDAADDKSYRRAQIHHRKAKTHRQRME